MSFIKRHLFKLSLLAALLAGVAWFLFSPLLFDEAVDEAFIDVSTHQAFMAMPKEKQQKMMDEVMDKMAKMPATEVEDPMMPAAPQQIKTAMFRNADSAHNGSGQAKLYRLTDGSHVLRLEDFRVTNGPDLVVYLAKHADPSSASDVSDGGFTKLGKLKGNVGNQNYPIPAEIDPAEYGSVVIWCELFGVLFSPAPFTEQ